MASTALNPFWRLLACWTLIVKLSLEKVKSEIFKEIASDILKKQPKARAIHTVIRQREKSEFKFIFSMKHLISIRENGVNSLAVALLALLAPLNSIFKHGLLDGL